MCSPGFTFTVDTAIYILFFVAMLMLAKDMAASDQHRRLLPWFTAEQEVPGYGATDSVISGSASMTSIGTTEVDDAVETTMTIRAVRPRRQESTSETSQNED